MRARIGGFILLATLLTIGIATAAGISPDALTPADFAFLPGADGSFVNAYRTFLKARAGDQPEGTAVPTYGEAARAFMAAAEGAADPQMKARCLWLATFSHFLDMDLQGAAETSVAMLLAAEQSHPRETALAREIIAQVDAGQIANSAALVAAIAPEADDAAEPPLEAVVVERLAAIIERIEQTREARGALTTYDLQTRLFNTGSIGDQLRIMAVLACFFREMSVSLSDNLRKLDQAVCVANLRQLGVALHLYAQDHDGLFPPAYQAEAPRIWQFKVLPYTGDNSWSERGPVWYCPACDGGGFSYGINQAVSYYAETSAIRGDRTRIVHPHETVLLADSVHYMPGDYPQSPNRGGAAYKIYSPKEHSGTGTIDWNRHSGGANVLFVDGRVEWRSAGMLLEWTGR